MMKAAASSLTQEKDKTMTNFRSLLAGSAIALVMAASSLPATAGGIPVYDAANFTQSVQQIMHTVTQINHQISMIDNQIKALQGSPFTLAPQVVQSLMQMKTTLDQATAMTNDPFAVSDEFRSAFPATFSSMGSIAQIAANLNGQVDMILNSSGDAALLQARVANNIPQIVSNVEQALALSNSAVGQTQAIQAGNQLNAVVSTQLTQLTSLMVAEQRTAAMVQASDQSRRKAAIEVHQRATAEIGKHTGTGYTPSGW